MGLSVSGNNSVCAEIEAGEAFVKVAAVKPFFNAVFNLAD